jgi:CHAT domain-containing protein
VEASADKWKQETDEEATVRLGPQASEESFKSEAAGHRVIHLATHGYFMEGIDRRRQTPSGSRLALDVALENPLLQSGLFFAGANLRGEQADSAGVEDGILTAYEVSALDLTGTVLVVLSACETGLGEVKAGEGVYGLRRAFQVAGARTVVSTLWPVPDRVTAEIISDLYGEHDAPLPATLRNAQLERLRDIRANGRVDHPVTWGAFIAIGDWR